MGYKWEGMQKLEWEEVLKLHEREKLVGCFYLYPDGVEGEIDEGYQYEDLLKHHEAGGEFGYEKCKGHPVTWGRSTKSILAENIIDGSELIKALMREQKIRQAELAQRIGIKRQSLNHMLEHSDGLKFKIFQRLLSALGYKIKIVKK